MKKSVLLIVASLGASSLFGQGFNFLVENNTVNLGGTAVTNANAGALNVSGFGFFVNQTDWSDFTSSDVWTSLQSTSITIDQLDAVTSYLGGLSGFGDVAAVNPVPIVNPVLPALSSAISASGEGFHPVLIVHDSTSGVAGLGVGSNIGIVASTSTTPALGTPSMGFNTTGSGSWDTYLVGEQGSLNLATVVPEPSHYAAALGLLGLGLVIWRRRRQ